MQWNNTGFTVNFKYWAMYVSSHIKKKTIQKKTQNCFWYAYMFFSSFLQLTLILHFYLYRHCFSIHTNNTQCVKFDYTFNKGSTHIFGILKKIKHSIKITLTVSNGILQFFLHQQSLYTELYEKFITPDCPCTK